MPFGRRDAYRSDSQAGCATWFAKRLRRLWRSGNRRPGIPSGRSLILCAAEAKNREENDSQKSEAEAEAYTFAEAFGQIDAENYADNEIHERDEHQQNPPPWTADDLAPNVKIVDWNDAGPTGLAGFGEHFPHCHYHQQRYEQPDNRRDRAWSRTLSAVAIIDFSEQACGRKQNGLRNFDE